MDKKFKIISFMVLIIICILLGYVIYSKAKENRSEDIEKKVLTQIEFIETKIIDFSNQLNNITLHNYKVTTNKIKEESENTEQKSNTLEKEKSNNKIYDLEKIDILSKENENIDWGNLSTRFQELYTSMPTITLDLYQTNINQEDILNFNKELDNLAINIKNKDKQKTLDNLCDLYNYIVKFTQVVSKEEIYKKIIESKNNILKAYSQIDLKDWNIISNNIQEGINNISSLLTSTNLDESKQYNINKVYVVLNELKNVTQKQDRGVFLIKYKKVLEEMKSV